MTRIDRSATAAREIVARLDGAAHALRRPVSRALAADILEGRKQIGVF